MTLLYPLVLTLLVPLILRFVKSDKTLVNKTHTLIMMLILLSLSRPIIEGQMKRAEVEARDIVIALDVSQSMNASDISPTRYAFAKETLRAFLHKNQTDNIMLIAFTSNPLLLSPPTTDHTLIKLALESLNPEYILSKSTSLSRLFEGLQKMELRDKTLLLISDGGEEKNPEAFASLLGQNNISLVTLALGTEKGGTIEDKDTNLIKDKAGHLVITRINPLLKSLTLALKGRYLEASSTPALTASAIHTAIDSQKQPLSTVQKMQEQHQELYQMPLLIAMLLFMLLHTRGAKYLLVLFLFLGISLEASVWDQYYLRTAYEAYETQDFNQSLQSLKQVQTPSLQGQMLLANLYYQQANYPKSIEIYKTMRSHLPSIQQQLFYNIANAYAHMGQYQLARSYYAKVLQLGEDADARHNLSLIALREDLKKATQGISHPKSQSQAQNGSPSEAKPKAKKEEEQSSSGTGAGGKGKMQKENKRKTQVTHASSTKHPLGSKSYELINEGYMNETKPW